MITRVVAGVPLTADQLQERYYLDLDSSITERTKHSGYGWYEPLAAAFPEQKHLGFTKGEQTSRYFRQHSNEIAALQADVYIMAFGCNDICYRNPDTCAMDANPAINRVRRTAFWHIGMKDFIHPNAHEGIRLYSSAVLQSQPPGGGSSRD